ncbi:hypothetical protein [Desulfobacterium sp. N47]|uniref:Uncharacterized protein n=1 Tax=uncultured Desulfobacterium sp. TaxID=201089 RepID=E1YAS7_9BACT|nr:unknown protein [uncultured Desulfobacterium sp.]
MNRYSAYPPYLYTGNMRESKIDQQSTGSKNFRLFTAGMLNLLKLAREGKLFPAVAEKKLLLLYEVVIFYG